MLIVLAGTWHLIVDEDVSNEATTSPVPGTTVAVVETPLPNGGVLADTPGIVVNMDAYKLWERIAVHGKGPREIKSLRPLNLIKVRML